MLAEKYLGYDDFLFVGRKYNIATAYEGALKLKKVSYVHAEGYPAGEMKHGPIALIDEEMPVLCLAPKEPWHEKMISQIQQAKALVLLGDEALATSLHLVAVGKYQEASRSILGIA